jgi:hypothetical protein
MDISRTFCCAEARRWLAAALVAWAGAGAHAAPAAADDRPVMSEPYRKASEGLLAVLFPGARRDWTNGDLIWPDGRQQKLSFTGLTWAPRDGGWWVASAVEFPDAFDEQVQRLLRLERPTERQAARVVVARADAGFHVLEQRTFDLDSESPLARLVSLDWLHFPAGPAAATGWPTLGVRASSGALVARGAGLIWWGGEFDVGAMSWSRRGPSESWRKEANGTETREQVEPASAATCPPSCDAPPFAALEAAARRSPARAQPSPR